jgi:hypothetical protein
VPTLADDSIVVVPARGARRARVSFDGLRAALPGRRLLERDLVTTARPIEGTGSPLRSISWHDPTAILLDPGVPDSRIGYR